MLLEAANDSLLTALIGILASLIAALVWVVKTTLTKSEERAVIQSAQIDASLRTLTAAVTSFEAFRHEEERTHSAMIATQHDTVQLLEKLTLQLDLDPRPRKRA